MASYEPSAKSTGLVGIKFDTSCEHGDQDFNVLVTLRKQGEEDFSVLYNRDGIQEGIDAADYLEGATELPTLVLSKERWGIGSYLAAFFAAIMISISVLGLANVIAIRIVLTGSMVPAINPGDVIVTVDDEFLAPRVNDVVVYMGKKFDGTTIAPFSHRIIGGDPINGWVVKGDANPDADIQHPTASDIDGVVVKVIPAVGKLLTPQLILLLGIALVGAWLVFDWARGKD